MPKILVHIAFLFILLTLVGCSSDWFPRLYRLDVRQGNFIDQDMLSRIQPGMSKRQVQFFMGTPLLADPFHQDRWDYFFSYSPRGQLAEQRHVRLYFEGELLARIEESDAVEIQ